MVSIESFAQNYREYTEHAREIDVSTVTYNDKTYPLISIYFGEPTAPTLYINGGIHGLERIGAQLCLSFLQSFHERLAWDQILKDMLKKIQVVFLPLANPYGYFETSRANGNSVDLMRNAPLDATEKTPYLLGGHHRSTRLPWYRGKELQVETQFVFDTVRKILEKSNVLISLDLHSGFGFKDQIWFPFAHHKKPFTQLNQLYLLFELFRKSFPHHIYKIEPQSKHYLTHGDLWDFSYLHFKKDQQIYLPLTLEMGSWMWVKKNPLQIFSKTGLFNPVKQHRISRTLRRHRPLFDFFMHALVSSEFWTNTDQFNQQELELSALQKYYVQE